MNADHETTGDEVVIRPAVDDDAAAIAAIYNEYVNGSTATFDTQPRSVEQRLAWLRGRAAGHPVFVAEKSGQVLGWAALSPYRERPAWAHTAEVAIYLDTDSRGMGIGPTLLSRLVDEAREQGHHALLAQVVTENAASMSTFARSGFRHVGTLEEVGHKFGRWLDVAIFQYRIDEGILR